jgi:iron complex transport system substrate-binding protein
MESLPRRPGWNDLKAVRQGRVFLTDGNSYFNRPGPRLVESAEILAEILHPRQFDFGHQGRGWIRADGAA